MGPNQSSGASSPLQGVLNVVSLVCRAAWSANHRPVGSGRQPNGILQEPIEDHPQRAGRAPPEPEREFLQVVVPMGSVEHDHVRAQSLTFQQGDDAVDARQDVGGRSKQVKPSLWPRPVDVALGSLCYI